MAERRSWVIGCGDVGLRVARQLRERGQDCLPLVRSPTSADLLRAEGFSPRILDLDRDAPEFDAEQVYWFAPPPLQGRTDPRLRRWLETLAPRARRIVYISTSGVYGDCAGRWINEDEPLKPQADRGHRRLDAEQALAEFAPSTLSAVCVLRVPGIYGPGRLPVERLRQGLPVVREDEAPWTNRIHAEDLARAALAAMDRGIAGRAYNVSDGHPTTMSDYFVRCARLLQLPEPPRVTMLEARGQLTPAMLSFLEESKRLVNTRMLDELGVQLRYPDLAQGLPACLP